MNSLVSIVVPVYNVKQYLKRCVESLINQTYKNIQIVLVDDGSTDGSSELCDRLSKVDKRIEVIHKKNGGLSDTRNHGIKKIKGKYVYFLDSDDFIEKDAIEIMLFEIIDKNLDIVCTNRILFWDNKKEKIKYKQEKETLIFSSKEAIIEMNKYTYIDMSASKMFKSDIFNNFEFPIGKLSEDMFIMYRIFDSVDRIGYISKPLLHYYQRAGSISKNSKINYDFIDASYEQMQFISKKYPELEAFMKGTYMVANLTSYNAVKGNGANVSKNDLSIIKKNIKKYYFKKNIVPLSRIRRIEIRLFITNTKIYNLFLKIYKKM